MPQPAPGVSNRREHTDLTGSTVGRFAVRARLGAGGMGEVYRADDTQLKRRVALKRIAPRLQSDQDYRQRFLREAQFASGLTNQHIAAVYDVLDANDEMFLVMEYVEGVTLRQKLSQPVSIEQFLDIAVQCAMGLVAAHERGIVHRDIKPENIMLTPAGEVKILDFGVAKHLPHAGDGSITEALGTQTSSFSGTPAYMAPEVLLEKPADCRADIFSLGIVVYEALGGRHPFQAASFLATTNRILHDVPRPLRQLNSKIPAELERIVSKMLAKDPTERYASAADLVVDLRAIQRVLGSLGVSALLPRPLPPPDKKRALLKRWPFLAALGVLLVAAPAGISFLPQVRHRIHWFDRAVSAEPKNLVVLPFRAIGEGLEDQAYCDGMTETLTAKLTQLTATHALQVAPAREVRTRRVSSAEEARKELGAGLVLEGTMYRSGKTVRVNYALVDTNTLRQIRADTITGEVADPFGMQDRVGEGVVGTLALELKPQEREGLRTHGTQVAGAYDLYLQGRGYLQNYDKPENVEHAISVFERALRLDPNYALAHAGLGEAYWKKYEAMKDPQWVELARKACRRAVTLAAKLAPAHTCLGTIEDGSGHYENAVDEFRRALETEPTSDDAYRLLGSAYTHLGKLAEAEQTYRRAIQLRPHYWGGYSWLGAFYFNHGRYTEAAEMFRQVVALAPDNVRGYYNLGAVYMDQGHYTEAIPMFERSLAIRPTGAAYSNLGTAYFYQRRYGEAARAYEEAVKLNKRRYELWGNLADAYYWAPGKRDVAPGAYRTAITLAEEELRVNPRDAYLLGNIALYYAMLGQRKPALNYLEGALKLTSGDADLLFKAAEVNNQLGKTGPALDWLEKAVGGGISATKIRNNPIFDNLRGDGRFEKLLRSQ